MAGRISTERVELVISGPRSVASMDTRLGTAVLARVRALATEGAHQMSMQMMATVVTMVPFKDLCPRARAGDHRGGVSIHIHYITDFVVVATWCGRG